ncbi:MAG TPA: zinc-binding dehydrogenase [Dehalococcoidia bacterium]|nr:zinc-binding dehydrogenase [Dehalococcoidia bacterium]
MKTRAAVHVEHGKPMVIDEIELPDPGDNFVIVKQFASGVCHSQLHQLHNPNQRVPIVIGHESTGVVTAKGRNVTHVKEGDHVMTTWLPRGAHEGYRDAEPTVVKFRGQEMRQGVFTSVFTWAEDVIVDSEYVVPMDKDVATDVTCIIGCAVMTGCGAAINTAKVRPGDSVAVFGVGGVGLCIVQAAANLSASPIIVVDLSDEKLEFAKQFGATIGINARTEDPIARIKEITGGGADFAFDAIGAKVTMEQILQCVRDGIFGYSEGGTAMLVGVPQTTAELQMGQIFRGAKIYRGTVGGTGRPDRDFPLYVRWYKEGKLPLDKLVSRRYKLEEINQAVADLEQGKIAGRAILTF